MVREAPPDNALHRCLLVSVTHLANATAAPDTGRIKARTLDVDSQMRISTPSGSLEFPDIDPRRPHPDDMLGLALDTLRLMPINGLRHPPTTGSCGWYVWGGETLSESADFFSPIPVRHLSDYVPNILPFLDLPPGFRFLVDNTGRKEAWFDGSLLDV